jgi:hypothetical protein
MGNKVVKKIIGYVLRIISIYIFIAIFAGLLNAILSKESYENGNGFFVGYLIGTVFGISIMGWINYQLYKYSGKLIYSERNKEEIDQIGKE